MLRIVEALEPLRGPQLEVGAAPHSLRAVSVGQLRELVAGMPAGRPLHIHIAEQQLEVRAVPGRGRPPPGRLPAATRSSVDARWCLVHATHLSDGERGAAGGQRRRAPACARPPRPTWATACSRSTPYSRAGGRFGIGSDSHVSQSPVEELRWLEYGQRLAHQRRNIAVDGARSATSPPSCGSARCRAAPRRPGAPVGALAPGRRADLLVLDSAHPNLDGVDADEVLGRFLFCGNDNLVRDVLAGGRWVVRGGRHRDQDAIAQRYKAAVRTLRAPEFCCTMRGDRHSHDFLRCEP